MTQPNAARPCELPSLTVDEVRDFLSKGINTFHNGGARRRIVVGVGFMLAYKTKPNSAGTSAVWPYAFAKWCKGTVMADGSIWTKGEAENTAG